MARKVTPDQNTADDNEEKRTAGNPAVASGPAAAPGPAAAGNPAVASDPAAASGSVAASSGPAAASDPAASSGPATASGSAYETLSALAEGLAADSEADSRTASAPDAKPEEAPKPPSLLISQFEVTGTHTPADLHVTRYAELPDIPMTSDQVVLLVGRAVEPLKGPDAYTVQDLNAAVKSKIVPPPEKKRYERGQVALLIWVFLLRDVLDTDTIDAFLKIVLWKYDLDEAYDRFCARLESSLTARIAAQQRTRQKVFSLEAARADDEVAAAADALAAQASLTALIASYDRTKHVK
jgi:hypothetical protein